MRRVALILISISLAVIFLCCGEDDPGRPGVGSLVGWPDRTEKEDCIEIIELVYEHRNIEKYREVLLKPDTDREKFKYGYIWYNKVSQGNPLVLSLDYDEDCECTQRILDNAEMLQLSLYPSVIVSETWTKIDEVFGEPCEDCWYTQRNYRFYVSFGHDMFMGDDEVSFVIGPDPGNPGKYVIYRADDLLTMLSFLLKPEKQHSISSQGISWGAVKSMYR